jgi:hypothetical protein
MDYYNDKYDRMCIDKSTNYFVDIVIKGNKIYKVKNYRWEIDSLVELNKFIEELTIDNDFVLSSSNICTTTLNQVSSESYVMLNVVHDIENNKKLWAVEYVIPEFISSVN